MPMRSDLVGRSNEPLPARVARARAQLEAAVDPSWRRDVRIPVGRGPFARPGCGVTGCRRDALNRPEAGQEAAGEAGVEQELCSGHRRRWISQGRPDLDRFVATKPKIVDYEQPRPCEVADCRVGRTGGWLCPHHHPAWIAACEPPARDWAAGVLVTEPQGPVCAIGRCPLVAASTAEYCRAHQSRRIRLGRPDPEAFEAHQMNYADSRWDFRRLPEQLKLKIQYAMQRADELATMQRELVFGHMIRVLLHVRAATLLEHTRGEWNDIFTRYLDHPRQHNAARAWLGFAVEQLTDLIEGDGWDHEYPRDVWELRRLGLRSNQRRLDFSDIAQPWLRELAKRWIHWRITVDEVSPVTATCDLKALRRLSGHLAATGQAAHSVAQLTRAVLESHLTWLRTQSLASPTIRDETSAIAVFLRALRDHEDWAPTLPRTATIYPSDYPRITALRARGLSAHVMVQVREHLPRWRDPDGRFLTELMLGTGMRVGDACALGFDSTPAGSSTSTTGTTRCAARPSSPSNRPCAPRSDTSNSAPPAATPTSTPRRLPEPCLTPGCD